ncbi:probable inactive serine/threonine-protein kinase slob2 [Schistocerca nitens]|uniref:probable inactive serine/threonine-protein kinase slob2 n=1 Tax=Schistocerca nitens TaxID=7011 RepID=UPI00211815F5|nr:probable inactive serine/threonine-protein kinase slob2 [Schistocerca nitens]
MSCTVTTTVIATSTIVHQRITPSAVTTGTDASSNSGTCKIVSTTVAVSTVSAGSALSPLSLSLLPPKQPPPPPPPPPPPLVLPPPAPLSPALPLLALPPLLHLGCSPLFGVSLPHSILEAWYAVDEEAHNGCPSLPEDEDNVSCV